MIGKAGSRGHQSLQNQESKGFVSTLQDMLPRWLGGSSNENAPRGNRRRPRPYPTASTRDGNSRPRRGQRRVRRSDLTENAEVDNNQRGTELRRRERRKTRKKEPIYQGHLNPGYDSERSWDNISIDSSTV